MGNAIVCEKKGHVMYIMLNRPEKLNAINVDVALGLIDAWKAFNSDDDARVAILYGAGERAFCAGADLNSVVQKDGVPPDNSVMSDCIPGMTIEVNKPIICAVRGHCIGAGFVLTMHSDLRIAAYDAKFTYPEPKMGVTAGKASVLAKHMPLAVALEMLLTGNSIDAKRAYEIGYVNKLVAPEDLLKEATLMAEEIAENAPLVVQVMKKLVYLSTYPTPVETSTMVNRILAPYRNSEDAKESQLAMKEKRKPIFKGR